MTEPNVQAPVDNTPDNGPDQIDVSKKFPNATRVENGVAFDASGKQLGNVDVPASASQPDPFAALGATSAPKPRASAPAAAGSDDPFAALGATTAPAPKKSGWNEFSNQWLTQKGADQFMSSKPIPGETGITKSVHGVLSFPNVLYHAFHDPATPQEKQEIAQKLNQLKAGSSSEATGHTLPAASTLTAIPNIVSNALTNTYDKPQPPTRTQLALHRLVDAPGDELSAKADNEIESAEELWQNRNNWNGAGIPTGMGVSIPIGHAIALDHMMSGAADKFLSKVPMLGPFVSSITEKFENGDITGALSDIALAKTMEAAHEKVTGKPTGTPSKLWSEKGNELGTAISNVLKKSEEVADNSTKANAAREDFMKSAPPSKVAPYTPEDYEIVRRTAEENHKADKVAGGQGIVDTESARDTVEQGRQQIENKRAGAVKTHADRPITSNVAEDVAAALTAGEEATPGFQNEGLKILDQHDFKDLTNDKADKIRKVLVAENRNVVGSDPWKAVSLRQTDPAFAAREAAIDSLRKGIYGSLANAGVPEAYDWARDEAAHIRVRNAIDRQMFNNDKTVRGTSGATTGRKILAGSVKTGAAAAGAGIGSLLGPAGAIVGGVGGGILGEAASKAILPPDITRGDLMARSFEHEVATPAGPTVPENQMQDIQYPNGPAGPDIPPPPQSPATISPVMPPPDHALHAALATRVGSTVERTNLSDLVNKFQKYLDKTPPEKLTEGDRDLLEQMNESQANHRAKIEDAMRVAVDKNKAAQDKFQVARQKWQEEVKKIQIEHKEKIAQGEATAQEGENKKNKALESDERIAHSPVMKATEPAKEIGGIEGRTPLHNMEHEHGHVMAFTAEGLNPIQMISESHPDAIEHNAAASVQTDVSDAEEGAKGIAQRVVGHLGGPAFDEVHHDISLGQNTAARSDIATARRILREEGGLSGKDLDKVFDALYDRAREHVSNPEALALVNANTPLREAGLHENFHMSPGRMSEYVKKLKGVYGNGETPTSSGVREGASDVGAPEGEPTDTGRQGKEQDGPAARVPSEEAREADEGASKPRGKRVEKANLDKAAKGLTERTTGSPETDEAIKQGGGVPAGVLGDLRGDHVKMFHDPTTGTTLGFNGKETVTAEGVKAKLAESRRQYAAAELPKEDFRGVHYSNVPAENGTLSGATRGAAKAGSEQARVALGAEPGVYAYREGARTEPQISSRANKYGIEGKKSIADISGAQKDLFHEAYVAGQAAALKAGDNDTTAFHKGLNAAETAVKNAGYDGYEDKEQYPGSTFLFGDQKVTEPNAQVAAHEANGGSTFTPEGKNLAGTDTHAVAPYPERSEIVDKLTPENLAAYKAKNADLLNDGQHAVGTWHDPDSGKTYLDISKTIADRDEAIKAGQDANQKAIYNLKTGETIPTGGTGVAPEIEQSNLAKYKGNKIAYREARSALDEMIPDDKIAHRAALTSLYQFTGGNKFVSRGWLNDLATKARAASMRGDFSQPLKVEQPDLGQPISSNPIYQEPTREPINALAAKQIGPRTEQSDLVKGSSVPLMQNPLPVKGTMEGGEVGTLDLTKALQKFSTKANPALEPGSEPKEMVARAKKLAEDEAKYQLAQSKTGTEWYTTEMKDHDRVLQDLRPELAQGPTTEGTDGHPVSLTLFKAAEAILSSGQKPYANVKSALKAWDAYKETGQFPPTNPAPGKEGLSWGPRGAAGYGNAFNAVNKLIADKGEKGAADWLIADHPVSELREYGENVSGKKDETKAGASILGEKRGPFMQNLHGIESKFTADMWVSRTWNRWMGTLDTDPRIEDKGKMTSESDSPRNNTERSLMKESFGKTADKLGLTTSSLQAVLWYYEQALYRAHGLPVESWSFSDAAKRVAGEHKAVPEAEQTGFNFGANKGGMDALANKLPVSSSKFVNLKK